ncbi:unnamed protein product [Mucor hiemalis]
MRMTGSKLIDGVLVHSLLKEVDIPSCENKGASVAEYVATVISLVRMVIINIIINIKKEDDLAFLSLLTIQNTCFCEDSSVSSVSSVSSESGESSTSSSPAFSWELQEKKLRILKKIEDAITDFIRNDDYVSLRSFLIN